MKIKQNMNQLGHLRYEWEGSMEVVVEQDETMDLGSEGELLMQKLVVLKRLDEDGEELYSCHRYFWLGFGDDPKFVVSVDARDVNIGTATMWLQNPRALAS